MTAEFIKEGIRSAYSPTVLVYSTRDADEISQRNGLNITTLFKPFAELEHQCSLLFFIAYFPLRKPFSIATQAACIVFYAFLYARRVIATNCERNQADLHNCCCKFNPLASRTAQWFGRS